jgi:spore germination cell wall hydrolase CwlJ-like protein
MLKALIGVASLTALCSTSTPSYLLTEDYTLDTTVVVIPFVREEIPPQFAVVDLRKRYRVLPKFSKSHYSCLEKTIQSEAGGENDAGALAVGNVVLNRMMDARFPSNICRIVHQDGQFTQKSNVSDRVKTVTRELLEGYHPDNTKGAVFFDNNGSQHKTRNFLVKVGKQWFYN